MRWRSRGTVPASSSPDAAGRPWRRRPAPSATAGAIRDGGGEAVVEPLDIADAGAVERVAAAIRERFGRLDILVNSAGLNVLERHWDNVSTAGWNEVVGVDLNGAFYCTMAVLPIMREQQDGLIINISSWAGRYDSKVTGPAYNAAKHGLLAMNASLNIEEGRHGIRGCAICPGEVATPIMAKRPVPVSDEDKARMLQEEDMGQTILFVARMPPHACVNEILISPTWNRLNMGD